MPLTRTWNGSYEAQPADLDDALQGAARIRDLKVDVKERLIQDHVMNETDNDGFHNKCTFIEQAADPTNSADKGLLYSKQGATGTQLFFRDSEGTVFQLTESGTMSPVSALGSFTDGYMTPTKNLLGTYVTGATATYTADRIIVENSAGVARVLTNFSKTLNIVTAGAGGLDTGAESANAWYYVWAIAKDDGTQNILMSLSSTTPTMPAGYTFKGLIGAIRNATSNFYVFKQVGRRIIIDPQNILSGGSATAVTSLGANLAIWVPPIAVKFFGRGTVIRTSGTGYTYALLYHLNTGSFASYAPLKFSLNGNVSTDETVMEFEMDIITAGTLYYSVFVAATDFDVDVRGFSL